MSSGSYAAANVNGGVSATESTLDFDLSVTRAGEAREEIVATGPYRTSSSRASKSFATS
jgi:hypothetical protein